MGKGYVSVVSRFHCRKCGHAWVPRIGEVRQCPRCKSYKWRDPDTSRTVLGIGTRLDGFDAFYQAYPRKRSKGDAEKAWKTLHPNEEKQTQIMVGLKAACASAEWKKEQGKYIPYPASWLRAKGWEDAHTQPLTLSHEDMLKLAEELPDD